MFKVGDRVQEKVQITDKMIRQFAEMSGDFNPIHMDENYAKTTVFGRRIAHGMISGALISRVLANQLGTGGVYLGQSLKFTQPLFIDDIAEIELTVTKVRAERGIGTVDTIVRNQKGDVCVKGEAVIMDGSVATKKS